MENEEKVGKKLNEKELSWMSQMYVLHALEDLNAAYDYLPAEDENAESISLGNLRQGIEDHIKAYN